ncbi:MAG TPA: SurA N-terminal domain-containing protein, partial [Anaerovoracaceae bacterium]|nr:SurA N-terminal domain-containing protein [Anaerovoracaceae bacterium]
MKKIIAVMLLIVLTMSLVACSGEKDNNSDLVKVGETTISENELEQYLEFTAFIQGVDTSQFPEESMKAIKSQMLDDMVALECIKQKYSGKEKEVFPDTIEADLKSFMDEAKNTEAISSFLKENKISDETLTKFFYNQNYRSAYFQEIEAGMTDLDKDAKAFYDANLDSFKVDEVTASHILVADEATAKD